MKKQDGNVDFDLKADAYFEYAKFDKDAVSDPPTFANPQTHAVQQTYVWNVWKYNAANATQCKDQKDCFKLSGLYPQDVPDDIKYTDQYLDRVHVL